jgi:hypothetical protein
MQIDTATAAFAKLETQSTRPTAARRNPREETIVRNIVATVLCVGAALAGTVLFGGAQAGDYYYGATSGYGRHSGGYRHHRVWYPTDCCFRKVTRHETRSHFSRIDEGYGAPYYSSRRYAPRYSDYAPRYSYYHDAPRYRARHYARYADDCFTRRKRVYDDWGGWRWTAQRVCY